jgi:uncharacterized protein YegL
MEGRQQDVASEKTPVIQEIYMLLDSSGSMIGAPHQSLQGVVDQFFRLLSGLIYRYNHITFNVITISYSECATLHNDEPYDLKEYPTKWRWPNIQEHGFTNFGDALKLLRETLQDKIASTTVSLPPFFIVVGDGSSSDDWRYDLAMLDQLSEENDGDVHRWLINLTDVDYGQMTPFLRDKERSITINQLSKLVSTITTQIKSTFNTVGSPQSHQVDDLEAPSTVF